MITKACNWYTIDEVIRMMGFETNNDLDWRVGALMGDYWEQLTGTRPDRDNRPKTNSNGSHSKAVYPDHFIKKIEGYVRLVSMELHIEAEQRARQMELFAELL